MTKPAISIITPTIGRDSLGVMLRKLLPQLSQGDEVLIVGDGPQPNAKKIVNLLADPLVRYWEHGPIWNYGNPQRNLAIAEAKGDYLMFIDDDDQPCPGAIDAVRRAATEFPGRPFMFKMQHPGCVLWIEPVLRIGQVSGQMFVPPNVKGRIGTWSGKYEADFDFMRSTLALYPDGERSIVWREDLTVIQGFAGRGNIGHEILDEKKEPGR